MMPMLKELVMKSKRPCSSPQMMLSQMRLLKKTLPKVRLVVASARDAKTVEARRSVQVVKMMVRASISPLSSSQMLQDLS